MGRRLSGNRHYVIAVLLGALWVALGISMIVTGISRYDWSWALLGVGYFFIAPASMLGWINAGNASNSAPAGRLVTGLAIMGLVLIALAVWGTFGNPVARLGLTSNVAPADLVRRPILYNDQFIRTSGYVSASNGWCWLETGAGDPPRRGAEPDPRQVLFLGSNSDLCKDPATWHVPADVSGTFWATRPGKDWNKPYVLRDAVLQPRDRQRHES